MNKESGATQNWPDPIIVQLNEAERRAHVLANSLTIEHLNLRSSRDEWSIGQCLQYLLVFNRLYMAAISRALDVSSRKLGLLSLSVVCLGMLLTPKASAVPTDRVQLTLDTSEADQVLAILALRASGQPIKDVEWQKLFATEPYQRLKLREAAIAKRFNAPEIVMKDEDFKKFVVSDDVMNRVQELRTALASWKQADLTQAGRRVLQYLPVSATIRAKVFPCIKPLHNSFVWETGTNPAIFLYLDAHVSAAKFENTVTHELHHIGLASAQEDYQQRIKVLPDRPRAVAHAMGSFGEGLAMLAAAGGTDIDPQLTSSPQEQERWKHDMANYDHDLRAIDAFFLDALNGKFADQDAIEEKASSFYGVQGPWYTVGYKMAVIVEKRFGREALIETMLDPRHLLVLYNQAASEQNRGGNGPLPSWSEDVLKQVQAR
jgi:hypothetical protein